MYLLKIISVIVILSLGLSMTGCMNNSTLLEVLEDSESDVLSFDDEITQLVSESYDMVLANNWQRVSEIQNRLYNMYQDPMYSQTERYIAEYNLVWVGINEKMQKIKNAKPDYVFSDEVKENYNYFQITGAALGINHDYPDYYVGLIKEFYAKINTIYEEICK